MIHLQIAGMHITLTDELAPLAQASNYRPFQVEAPIPENEHLFQMGTTSTLASTDSIVLSHYTNETGSYTVYLEQSAPRSTPNSNSDPDKQEKFKTETAPVYYWKLQRTNDPNTYGMKLNLQRHEAWLNFQVTDIYSYNAANDFMRFAFIYASAFHQTLLLHASTISYQGRGIAFVGRSGIGKSTHSALWLKYIKGSELLNDDQPAVRIHHDTPYIYGTPWSGKTPCYKQERVPLEAIVCMEQASENRLARIAPINLYSRLLSAISFMKTDRQTLSHILKTQACLVGHARGAVLQNRPEKEAADLSFNFLKNV